MSLFETLGYVNQLNWKTPFGVLKLLRTYVQRQAFLMAWLPRWKVVTFQEIKGGTEKSQVDLHIPERGDAHL